MGSDRDEHPLVGQVRAWMKALWGDRDEGVYEYLVPGARVHGLREGPGRVMEIEAYRAFVRGMLAAFPDFVLEVQEGEADGDLVWVLSRIRGTHLGSFLGVPATRRTIRADALSVSVVRDGRTIEGHLCWDLAGVLVQVGGLSFPAGSTLSDLAPRLVPVPGAGPDPEPGVPGRPRGPAERVAVEFATRLFQGRDEGAIDELVTPRCRVHRPRDGLDLGTGREELRRLVRGLFAALPDLTFRSRDLLGGAERAFWRFEAEGTQLGALYDVPARGRRVQVKGAILARVRGGRIDELWFLWELADLLVQLGRLGTGGTPLTDLGADRPPARA